MLRQHAILAAIASFVLLLSATGCSKDPIQEDIVRWSEEQGAKPDGYSEDDDEKEEVPTVRPTI